MSREEKTRAPEGEPPFRVKGLVYLGARAYLDAMVPGGSQAVHAAIAATGDDALASFFQGPFAPGAWYDSLPITTVSAFAARLRGVPHSQHVRENAAWLARRDLTGVYRVFLELSPVQVVALRLPKLSMRYFDFGSADGKMLGERLMESHRFGIPAPLAPWFIFAVEGFVPVALQMAGAKRVSVRSGPPRDQGLANGCRLIQLRFEIGWE